MDKSNIPAVLYQYMREGSVAALRDCRIKTSSWTSLNDPFECSPAIDGECTPDELFRSLTFLYETGQLPKKPTRYLVARLMDQRREMADDLQDMLPAGMAENFRLVCLSCRNDGILMWAHYAAAHKGFVIGYKTNALVRHLVQPLRVTYTQDRPRQRFVGYDDPTPTAEALREMVGTKSEEWRYEEEVRLHAHISALSADCGSYFLTFDPSAVVEVIFGSRCTVVDEVTAILDGDQRYLHVVRLDAVLDRKKFAINFRPHDPGRWKPQH